MKIKLSIIIVNYNTKKLTLQCIESVVQNTAKLHYEIIVVDNNSNDGSKEAIRTLTQKYKNLKLIENKVNLGFSKANNIGIRKSSGKYVLLLNSDAKVSNNSLKKLVDFAEKTKDAGVVAPRLLNSDSSIQNSCFRFPTITRAIKQYWLGEKGSLDKYYPKTEKLVEVDAVVGAAFLITPQARKKVGLLNEKYFMYFEDIDYCRKVLKSGLKVYYLPTSEIIHYHGKSGKDISDTQKRRLITSSKIYHGILKHFIINLIIWSGQKWQKLISN